jgi:colanic acid/amylovoran biosynthesis glycosyltransferase
MVDQLRLNGIQAESIPLPVPAPAPGYRRIPLEVPLLLYCGRLDVEKGVDLLLRAFASVLTKRPDARLRILGDGPRRGILESLAAHLGIREAVRFDGWVPFSAIEEALSQAWALVAPSLWPEPLGLIAIEAITRGVPVIVSAAGGFAETVEEGKTGYLIPNGDGTALTDSLISLVNSRPMNLPPVLVQTLLERHDAVHHAAHLTAVFREAIEARAVRTQNHSSG